jgi:hypothetical protein
MRLKAYVLPVLQFALMGPFVGAIVLLVMAAGLGGLYVAGRNFIIFIMMSYGAGLMPAVIAGTLYVLTWNARSLLKGLTPREFGVLSGAIMGVIGAAICVVADGGLRIERLTATFQHLLAAFAGGRAVWRRGGTHPRRWVWLGQLRPA